MKERALLVVVAFGLFAGVATAQNHAPVYLTGGYSTTSSIYWNGLFMVDEAAKTLKHLTPGQSLYASYAGVAMDYDNKNVILALTGTTSATYSSFLRSGLFRLDPNTLALSTVLMDTMSLYAPRGIVVNQDGDYLVHGQTQVPSAYIAQVVDRTGTTQTTVFSSASIPATPTTYGTGINMDTGNYFINATATGYYYNVFDVSHDGTKVSVWAGGTASPNYGWYSYYSLMEQDFDTGHLVHQYSGLLYELKQNDMVRTSVYNLGYQGDHTMYLPSRFDLQSAGDNKQIVATGYKFHYVGTLPYYTLVTFHIDAKPPYTVTSVEVDPTYQTGKQYHYSYGMEIYQSRNVQTVRTLPGEWDVRISCPNHAGMAYVAALSLAGYRPGLPLPDGRKIYVVPDIVTYVSMSGLLKPWFDPGPGVLDKNGEAVAHINMGPLKLDIPAWIVVVVLDPKAPGGIAFIPDTRVIRL